MFTVRGGKTMLTATEETQAQVSTEGNSNALRQRRYRLRKQYEASGNANLYVACQECEAAIKPSYHRGFCPGGACRKRYYKRVQVTHVCRITRAAAQLSEAILVQGLRLA
jgi:hypothetical protein